MDGQDAVLLLFVGIAAVTDSTQHRIYNWTTYPGIVVGILCSSFIFDTTAGLHFDSAGLSDSLVGLASCGGIMLTCFLLSDMGGGDVKLLAMVGAFLGLQAGLTALLWTIVLGGVLGLAILIGRVGAWTILVGTLRHLSMVVRARGWVPLEQHERAPLGRTLFLAPATFLGVLLTVMRVTERLGDHI